MVVAAVAAKDITLGDTLRPADWLDAPGVGSTGV
jgi:hypothetical protein